MIEKPAPQQLRSLIGQPRRTGGAVVGRSSSWTPTLWKIPVRKNRRQAYLGPITSHHAMPYHIIVASGLRMTITIIIIVIVLYIYSLAQRPPANHSSQSVSIPPAGLVSDV